MRTNPKKFSGAWRLSNVFRVCRQGLTALTVVFMFMACDQLPTTGGSGKLVQVKIRAVRVAGGSQNETVTRAGGGGGERRIVQEPVIQDLGGGMLAEITVEEDVSALRDDPYKKLENNAKLRIVALKKNTSEIYSWADYTATTSGEFSKVAGNLHVVSGVKYDFVCFSYNDPSFEASWPDPLSEGGTLDVLTVDNTRNFLYKKLIDKEFTAISNTLDLTLEPQLAKVKLEFDAGTGKTIEGIDNSKITLDGVATTVNFNLVTVSASSITTTGKLAFGGGTTGSRTLTSGEISFFPQATGNYILSIAKDAVSVSDSKTIDTESISIPCSRFEAGKRYTIRLKPLARVGYFAGELTPDANGVWKFTKELYVQNADASTGTTWSSNNTSAQQGDADDTNGKANTLALSTNTYDNPAAKLCFQKNTGYATITGVSDANYQWYLPARKQLMALWAIHDSVESAAKLSGGWYWSSTEHSATHSWIVSFSTGYTDAYGKTDSYLARCVREL